MKKSTLPRQRKGDMIKKNQIEIMLRSPLFKGLSEFELQALLKGTGVQPRRLSAGETALEQGQRQSEIFVILSGAARGEKLTADGRSVIVNEFFTGHVFGEVLSGASEESPVSVKMISDGEVLSIPLSAFLTSTEVSAPAREAVVRNLISEIAVKYLTLLRRVDMILCPTLRGKIASYLLFEGKNATGGFLVPHTREEQAQLLSCDRSALSRELSRMKREGLLDYKGNWFAVLDYDRLKNEL